MRWLRGFLLISGSLALASCDDSPSGKSLGEACVAHEECASKLCSILPLEAGMRDGSVLPAKRCLEPGLQP